MIIKENNDKETKNSKINIVKEPKKENLKKKSKKNVIIKENKIDNENKKNHR